MGPVFIQEPPSNLLFDSTVGALVLCTAYGKPTPALKWVVEEEGDLKPVPTDPGKRNKQLHPVRQPGV